MGIWGELKLENLYRNPDGNPIFWDEVLLDAVLAESNLTLLLNTQVDTLHREGCRVSAVEGTQQGTEKKITVEADWFLDATGDGTLGALAGLPYYLGEQLVVPGQEPEPPFELLGSSLLFYTEKTDRPVTFHAPAYAWSREKVEALLQGGGRIVEPTMSGSDCWGFELGGRQDTIGEDGDIALELRRLVLGVWDYIKNSGRFAADCYTLSWIGSIPGKRESRRMVTDYLLGGRMSCAEEILRMEPSMAGGIWTYTRPAVCWMPTLPTACRPLCRFTPFRCGACTILRWKIFFLRGGALVPNGKPFFPPGLWIPVRFPGKLRPCWR